jgi:CshA-type fibril repeat protein
MIASNSAGANAGNMSLSLDYTPNDPTVATSVTPGNKIDLRATAPVSLAGTTTQEIVQEIGSELRLTSTTDIIAPTGWTVFYSTNGNTWSDVAPTSPESWASLTHVKAKGLVISEGADDSGRQIASADAAAQPTAGSFPSTASASSGDGWDVFFDDAGRIYNIWHHNGTGSNQSIDCHLRTGESCGPTWPYLLRSGTTPAFTMHTSDQSAGWFDSVEKKIWFPTVYTASGVNQVGFACIRADDITLTNKWCGGSAASAFISAGASQNIPQNSCIPTADSTGANFLYDCTGGLAEVDGKLYAWQVATGDLICIDIRLNGGAGGACEAKGSMINPGSISFPNIPDAGSTGHRFKAAVMEWGGRVYGFAGARNLAVCVEVATQEPCVGWTTDGRTLSHAATRLFRLPSPSGSIAGLCIHALNTDPNCFDADGIDITNTLTSAFKAKLKSSYVLDNDKYSNYNPNYGSRIYWGDTVWNGVGKIYCWDFSTDSVCANWPSAGVADSNYQLTLDPSNPNCLWSNSHDSIIQTFDARTGTESNCALPAPTVVFDAGAAVPRMACSGEDALHSWRSFALTTSFSYTSATLTIKNSSGGAITGWTDVPIDNDPVELSSLAVADSGLTPTFTVTFVGREESGDVSARVTAVGGAPQLCLTPVATLACVGPTYDAGLLGPRTATVTATGTAFASNGTGTPINAATQTVNIDATALSQCDGGSISGKALIGTTPIVGALVSLLDGSGNPLNYPADWSDPDFANQPITALTASDGTYSFPNLVFGTYKVSFADTTASSVYTTTVTTAGTGTTTDTGAPTALLSNLVTLKSTTKAGVVNAVYASTPVLTKRFDPTTVAPGQSATLIFTITKADTLVKSGLGFVDTLPSGLAFASSPNISSTCTTQGTASAVSGVFSVTGFGMGTAQSSCIYQVSVVAAASGSYTNDDQNVTTTGLIENVNATLIVPEVVAGTFVCDSTLYFMKDRQLFRQNPTSTAISAIGLARTTAVIQGLGRNPNDGFLYGIVTVAGDGLTAGNIARIKSDGIAEDVGPISGVTTTVLQTVVGGDFDAQGNLVVKTGTKSPFYTINLSTRVAQAVTITGTASSHGQDLAFFDGKFYLNEGNDMFVVTQDEDLSWGSVSIRTNGSNSNSGEIWVNGFGELVYNVIKDTGTRGYFFAPSVEALPTSPSVTYKFDVKYNYLATDGASCNTIPKPNAFPDSTSGPMNTPQSTTLVGNDTVAFSIAGNSYPLNPATVKLCDPETPAQVAPGCTATSVTVDDVGTYLVDASGFVTFTPVTGYTGTPDPIGYQVSDSQGNVGSSTYTPTVSNTIPIAYDDTSTGDHDVNQLIDVLDNDLEGTTAPLDLTSVRLCSDLTSLEASCTLTTLVVDGEGTYTVNTTTGVVTFDPLPTFSGVASPIKYVVEDTSDQITSAEIQVTVTAPPLPSATPDVSSGNYDTNQTISPLANDNAGANTAPLSTSSLKLCGTNQVAPDCVATSLVVSGVGTYTVNAGGTVTFDPLPTFVGTAPAINYQVSDLLDRVMTSTITPTVGTPPAPTASPNTSTGVYDTNQTINPLSNDSAGASSFPLVASSVKLCDPDSNPAEVSPNCSLTTLTIDGEGTYTVNPTTGVVTFNPLPTFTGTATAVNYQVKDSRDVAATSTITPTVTAPPAPVLSPDTSSGDYNLAQSKQVLTNDTNVTAELDETTVKLCAPFDVAPGCTLTTLPVANQGTYEVDPITGEITFTPVATFTGTATAVTYSVEDVLGVSASTTYTPSVGPPPPPTASPNTSTGNYDTNQTISPLGNDAVTATAFPLDATTLKLCGASETAPNCTLSTLTIAGEGTYTVNPDGTVTFDPLPTFRGTATTVNYQVSDTRGVTANSTITATVNPPAAPVLTADSTTGALNATQNSPVLTNDTNVDAPLDPTTVKLCKIDAPADVAPDCSLTTLTTSAGTYSVNPTTGAITFAPVAGFVGTGTAVTYSVEDITGQKASITYTPTVIGVPTAQDDVSSGKQGDVQTVNLLTNTPGLDSAATGATLNAASVKLCGAGETPNNCTKTEVSVAGVGTYSVNSSGLMTFTPEPAYFGTPAPLSYTVSDNLGQKATADYTPSVFPAPNAVDDTSSGKQGAVQAVSLISNDFAGFGSTLDPNAITLCEPSVGQTPPDCTKTSVTIAGEGSYAISASGEITFTPEATFVGVATPLQYRLMDSSGQSDIASYTPTVVGPPTAVDDTSSGAYNTAQTEAVLSDDTAANGTTLVSSSVKLCKTAAPADVAPNCTLDSLEVANQGTYSVNVNGSVTFTPLATFVGAATAVTYSVTDALGQKDSATYTPTVAPPPAPTATADTSTGAYDVIQTIAPLGNDTAGAVAFPLDPLTVKLCGPAQTAPNCDKSNLVVANQGTYTVNADGTVSFDPLPTFTGVATQINYQVSDARGVVAASTITVTVGSPAAPTAVPDAISDTFDTNQIYNPITNDSVPAADFPLDPTSVKLCSVGTTSGCNLTTLTVPNQGTYTVNTTTGAVTFDPLPTFTGTATAITYSAVDSLNRLVSSTITPTVGTPPAPAASPDALSDSYDLNQSYSPIANDNPGTSNFPLVASTLRLCAEGTTTGCNLTTLTVANEGTYSVNTSTGVVTFNPLPTFVGVATAVTYSVSDSLNRVVSSTITPTVGPPPAPTASPNTSSGDFDQNQIISPIANDTVGAAAFPFVNSTLKLCAEGTTTGCNLTTLTIADEGTYTVNANGTVSFDPLPTFIGVATPINYQVADSRNQVTGSTITVTVRPPAAPQLVNDYSTGIVNTDQVFLITGNDVAAPTLTIVPATAFLCDATDTAPNCDSQTLTIANEGTYTLDSAGQITFVPVQDYVGTATPVRYIVEDSLGQVATAQIFVVVTESPKPLAVDDSSSGIVNQVQTINLLSNDSSQTGYPILPAPTVLCLLDPAETAPACTGTRVQIDGEGLLEIVNGVVTFTPETDFIGSVTAVNYVVENSYGELATAVIRITVTPPPPPAPPVVVEEKWPTATPDKKRGSQNSMVVFTPETNDLEADTELDPKSIMLCVSTCDAEVAEANLQLVLQQSVPEGEWSVDPSTGQVTFMPAKDWFGTVKINYVIWALDGKMADSTITVVIEAPETIVELADTGFDQLQLFIAGVLFLVFGTALLTGSRLGRFPVTGN